MDAAAAQDSSGTPPPDGAALSRRRKAAVVVQLLLASGRTLPLDRLPEGAQLALTRELADLKLVDRATVASVAGEFTSAVEQVGLPSPGGIEGALAALDGQISGEAAGRLKREIADGTVTDPWEQVRALEVGVLQEIMTTECTEIAAVLLSKLPVARAAELLASLPGEIARRTAVAVSRTGAVTPEAVRRIGAALAEDYALIEEAAFPVPPDERVGAILNSSPAETRDGVLEGLAATDPDFAEQVQRTIFTFPDIPARVPAVDLPKVLRLIETEVLVTALAGAGVLGDGGIAAADFILNNMSKRMAEQLREAMGERAKVKPAEGDAAMAAVIAAIRDAADRGEITMSEPEEAEEAA